MDHNTILSKHSEQVKGTVIAFKCELQKVRTGRASSGLVENIQVDYYGTPTPLNQLAAISVPEAKTITIQAWDKGATASIEKSILKSELGLTPINDGNLIRLRIPPLTEERRRDLVRTVHKRIEEGKVAIRNVRREAIE